MRHFFQICDHGATSHIAAENEAEIGLDVGERGRLENLAKQNCGAFGGGKLDANERFARNGSFNSEGFGSEGEGEIICQSADFGELHMFGWFQSVLDDSWANVSFAHFDINAKVGKFFANFVGGGTELHVIKSDFVFVFFQNGEGRHLPFCVQLWIENGGDDASFFVGGNGVVAVFDGKSLFERSRQF